MAEMFGKQEGCSRGRGGSMHLFDHTARFFGGQAIVGGGLPLAAGLALADKMGQRQALTACFFGEGAMAEGAFHEAVNLAALWQLPVLFLCENNLYSMGTALARAESQTDLCAKAASYGVATVRVDGMDVRARAVGCAIDRCLHACTVRAAARGDHTNILGASEFDQMRRLVLVLRSPSSDRLTATHSATSDVGAVRYGCAMQHMKEPVSSGVSMGFGLRAVASALRNLGSRRWCEEEASRLTCRLADLALMKEARACNEVNCKVMMEAISCLRLRAVRNVPRGASASTDGGLK